MSDGGRLTLDGVASRIEVDDGLVDLIRGIEPTAAGSGFGDLLRESVSGTVDPQESSHRIRRVIDPELDPDGEARRRRRIADLVEAATVRPSASSRRPGIRATVRDPERSAVATGSLVTGTGGIRRCGVPGTVGGGDRPGVRPVRRARARRSRRVAVAAPRAWDQLSRGWDALVHPVNASSAQNRIEPVSPPPPAPEDPAAAGGVAPAAVDTGAPAASGQITGVTASFADGSCSPGKPCAVRVDVRLDPSTVGAVTWKLNVYDRCTGEVREGSDVTIPAEPGRDGVYGLSRATLPDSPPRRRGDHERPGRRRVGAAVRTRRERGLPMSGDGGRVRGHDRESDPWIVAAAVVLAVLGLLNLVSIGFTSQPSATPSSR